MTVNFHITTVVNEDLRYYTYLNYLLQWFLLEYTTNYSSVRPINTSTSRTGTEMLRDQSKTVIIAIGVSTVILLILSSALIITVIVLIFMQLSIKARRKI